MDLVLWASAYSACKRPKVDYQTAITIVKKIKEGKNKLKYKKTDQLDLKLIYIKCHT